MIMQDIARHIGSISNENIIPVARAFQSILNLTNIAEQYQTISREHSLAQSSSQSLSELFKHLKNKIFSGRVIKQIENY